jgi:ankyrin repeat protein
VRGILNIAPLELIFVFLDRDDETPLHWAVVNGHSNVVDWLVREGANIDARSRSYAKSQLRYADICIPDCHEETALHVAAWGGHLNVTKWLLKHSSAHVTARGWSFAQSYFFLLIFVF